MQTTLNFEKYDYFPDLPSFFVTKYVYILFVVQVLSATLMSLRLNYRHT